MIKEFFRGLVTVTVVIGIITISQCFICPYIYVVIPKDFVCLICSYVITLFTILLSMFILLTSIMGRGFINVKEHK